jgi:hypothetical protein
MNKDDLIRKLNSVGKQAFVENFYLFQRYATNQITRTDCIAFLVEKGVSNDSGAARRAGSARIIFNHCKELEALRIIVQSQRLPLPVREQAKIIIKDVFNG